MTLDSIGRLAMKLRTENFANHDTQLAGGLKYLKDIKFSIRDQNLATFVSLS